MTFRTDTRALVLAVLIERPLHGYGISKTIREISGDALKLGEGQLYPILHSLEEQGWILGEWEMQEGDPPRKVYRVTESGLLEFETRRNKWMKFASAVASVMGAGRTLGGVYE